MNVSEILKKNGTFERFVIYIAKFRRPGCSLDPQLVSLYYASTLVLYRFEANWIGYDNNGFIQCYVAIYEYSDQSIGNAWLTIFGIGAFLSDFYLDSTFCCFGLTFGNFSEKRMY